MPPASQRIAFLTALFEVAISTSWPIQSASTKINPSLMVAFLSCLVCIPLATASFIVSRTTGKHAQMLWWERAHYIRQILICCCFLSFSTAFIAVVLFSALAFVVSCCCGRRVDFEYLLHKTVYTVHYSCVYIALLTAQRFSWICAATLLYYLPLQPRYVVFWAFDWFLIVSYCNTMLMLKESGVVG